MNTIKITVVALLIWFCFGCASSAVSQHYQASRLPIQFGVMPDGMMVGIDLVQWQTIVDHPVTSTAAAIFDTVTFVSLVKLAKDYYDDHLSAQNNDSPQAPQATITITIQGNNNTVNYWRPQ